MDYYRHFALTRRPFEILGQPTSLYLSKAHREGLAALEWGLLHEPGCFTLLVGEVGTGKTTLINVILGRHYEHARIAYLTNPKLSFEDMLREILEQLGYLPTAATKLELLKKFEWLLGQLRPKERIAIIIDEAQGLSDDALEELRLFSNYSQNGKNQLEILLVGQPELLTRLMAPELRQFHQRIGARAVLNRLQRREAFEYVDLKLRDSGGSVGAILAKDALAELIDHSDGIPRQLNLLCNNALIRAYAAGLRRVTLDVARATVREYEHLPETVSAFGKSHVRTFMRSTTARVAISVAGLGLAVLGGIYYYSGANVAGNHASRPGLEKTVPSDAGAKHLGMALVDKASTSAGLANPGAGLPSDAALKAASLSTPPPTNESTAASVAVEPPQASKPPPSSTAPRAANSARASGNTVAFSVRRGDTIEKLAVRHLGSEVAVQKIAEANPQLRDVNRIYPGETVFIPFSGSRQGRE
jgi:general secretion pathway protein A